MESTSAAENLQIIRTLMERSALYRRALAPIMTFCGVLGVVAGIIGWQLKINSDRGFVLFWSGVAAAGLTGSFILVRRQALKDSEPFWSPPTRRVAQAMLPPLAVGMFMGIVVVFAFAPDSTTFYHGLAMIWSCLYGCALHSAGFFISRGIRILGWLFVLVGCALLICIVKRVADNWQPHLLMGGIFGGLHLVSGIYLYFTEKGKNAA